MTERTSSHAPPQPRRFSTTDGQQKQMNVISEQLAKYCAPKGHGPAGPMVFSDIEVWAVVSRPELKFVACSFRMKCIMFTACKFSFLVCVWTLCISCARPVGREALCICGTHTFHNLCGTTPDQHSIRPEGQQKKKKKKTMIYQYIYTIYTYIYTVYTCIYIYMYILFYIYIWRIATTHVTWFVIRWVFSTVAILLSMTCMSVFVPFFVLSPLHPNR